MSISGKFLSASTSLGTIVGNHEWTYDETGDRLDATTGADQGRGNPDCGVIDTKVTVKFYLDIVTGVYTFIRTGTILTGVELFVNINDPSPIVTITEATVFNFQIVGQIRDKMVATAQLEANGDVITCTDPAA
jgi:hypothetical protein